MIFFNSSIVNKAKSDQSNHPIDSLDVPGVIDNNDNKATNTELQPVDSETVLANRLKALNKRNHDFNGPIIPVIVFACNRISVKNCLDDLVKYRPNSYQFPIIVSQVSFTNKNIYSF